VDQARIKAAIDSLLDGIGADRTSDGISSTPARVAEMYVELFSGIGADPRQELEVSFEAGHHEIIVVSDVPFYSMCEHHLLPFFGKAHVGYIPNREGRIVGMSKLARAIDMFARRPQVQERLTTQIADAINDVVNPEGVMVVIEAEHLCMTMRGVRKPGSTVVTIAARGLFNTDNSRRTEFLSLIGKT
jgi:GTP cyclohydrolase IA